MIKKNGFYFNPNSFISYEKSNLSSDIIRFSSTKDHSITCKMISYDKKLKSLKLHIIDYNNYDEKSFQNQKPSQPITFLEFDKIDWNKIQGLLSFYHKASLSHIIEKTYSDTNSKKNSLHTIEVSIPIAKCHFQMGKVSFSKKFKWSTNPIELEINNPHIISEFNHIKFYFTKLFKKKTISVKVHCESTTNGIIINSLQSTDIDKINQNTIEIIKTKKYDEWTKKKHPLNLTGKEIFNFDEMLEQWKEESFGNLDMDEKAMLFSILKENDIRNAPQLQYLSGKIQENRSKVMLTLNPQFGFTFHFIGEELQHFIWELLHSHATYIWSVDKKTSLKEAKEIISNQIALIKALGRTQYKNELESDSSFYFHSLTHQSSKTNVDDPFPKWILTLHELLI